MSGTETEIRPVALAHLEQCSETRQFSDGRGHYEVLAKATIAIHKTLVGKELNLRFLSITARAGDYFLIPAELKLIHPNGETPRREVSFASVKLKGALNFVQLAEATTKELRELIETYAFERLTQMITAVAAGITESAGTG